MEPTDLTIAILREIRDELRSQGVRTDNLSRQLNDRFSVMDKRIEAIETTLRDLAEQMVLLARGVKTALEVRGGVERRLDDLETRLASVEKRQPH